MDWGRARVRHAHRLPPDWWDNVVLFVGIMVLLSIVMFSR